MTNLTDDILIADPCREAWDKALADYQAMRAAFEAMPSEVEDYADRMCDLTFDVQDRLLGELRAPDVDAFAMKIGFIKERDIIVPDEWLDALLADVRHLLGSDQSDMQSRIAAYYAVRHEEAAYPKPMTDAVSEEFGKRRASLFRAVVNAPAGSVDEITRKLEVCDAEYRDDDAVPRDDMMAIIADLRGLSLDPHMGMMPERDALIRSYNDTEAAAEAILDAAREIEKRILTTPARTRDGILAKALLVMGEHANGGDIPAQRVFAEAKAMGLMEFEV